ncbi:MAG: hotdog fold thioesterase [Clostridiales Family XIII bacterium]|jgi:acyl-CoA thioesterase|nr:hotdog fold thioesterase [Clostridiales Family XIII bacterium]
MNITIERIRAIFSADKYLMMAGVVIEEIGEDYCKCSLRVGPEHMNAGGAAQGGAIYTLADSAFAVASNIGNIDRGDKLLTVSQSASISYLRAGALGETLYAEGRKVGGGKKTPVFRMDVTNGDGTVIATMTGNGYTVPRR